MLYKNLSVAGCAALMFGLLACSGEDGADGVNGTNGADGASCEVKTLKSGEGYKVLCGGDSVGVLLHGKTGATGATGKTGATGATGKTGATGATGAAGKDGKNGVDGKDGKDGVDGINGKDGVDGKDGTSCVVEPATDGYKVLCGTEEVGFLKNGAAGTSCSTSPSENGIVIKCGSDETTILNGKSCSVEEVKDNGKTGLQMSCADGTSGIVWDGVDGADGADGANGTSCTAVAVEKDGIQGLKMTCGEEDVGTIWNGAKGDKGLKGEDGQSCFAESVEADGIVGLKMTCGDDVVGTVWNGVKGDDGISCESKDNENGTVTISCGTSKPVTIFKAMCDINPYDPYVSFCVDGAVYSKCNGKVFNPESQFCNDKNEVAEYCYALSNGSVPSVSTLMSRAASTNGAAENLIVTGSGANAVAKAPGKNQFCWNKRVMNMCNTSDGYKSFGNDEFCQPVTVDGKTTYRIEKLCGADVENAIANIENMTVAPNSNNAVAYRNARTTLLKAMFASTSFCQESPTSIQPLCGDKTYTSSQFCQTAVVDGKTTYEVKGLCNGQTMTATQFCQEETNLVKELCGDATFKKDEFCQEGTNLVKPLCGEATFKQNEFCQVGTNLVKPLCGDATFKKDEFCQEGTNLVKPLCGEATFKQNEFCQVGTNVVKTLCGDKTYTSTQFCQIVDEAQNLYKVEDLCNGQPFVNGKFCQEETNYIKDLCNGEPYKQTEFCQEETNVVKPLCGDATFKKDEFCQEETNLVKPLCGDATFKKNEFCDTHDNHVYGFHLIYGNYWMTENLSVTEIDGKAVGLANPNGPEYGRYYTYAEAIDACPEGWVLPSAADYENVASKLRISGYERSAAFRAPSWNSGAGAYSFNALPAGYYNGEEFLYVGNEAYFWTDEIPQTGGVIVGQALTVFAGEKDVEVTDVNIEQAISVRCMKK